MTLLIYWKVNPQIQWSIYTSKWSMTAGIVCVATWGICNDMHACMILYQKQLQVIKSSRKLIILNWIYPNMIGISDDWYILNWASLWLVYAVPNPIISHPTDNDPLSPSCQEFPVLVDAFLPPVDHRQIISSVTGDRYLQKVYQI